MTDAYDLVRINPRVLTHLLHMRGKCWSSLRGAGVSYDTMKKIKDGVPVQPRIVRKITVALHDWPELMYADELLADGRDGK